MTLDARLTEAVRYVVDRSMLWAFVIVLVSACILGWSYQSSTSYLWAAIAVAVVLGEVGAIHKAVEAHRDGNRMVVGAGVAVWAVCFTYSFVQSMGVAATSQEAGAALRQAKHVAYEDASDDVAKAQDKYNKAAEALSKLKPARSASDARAEIDKAEAHRFWQMTNSCKETKGPQTRAFCDNYRAAEADLRSWDDISVKTTARDTAKAELDKAKRERRAAPVSTAAVDPFSQIVHKYTNMDVQTVSDVTATQKTITVNSILTLTALMLFAGAAGTRRKDEPPAPLHTAEPSTRIVERHTVETDGRFDRLISNLNAKGLLPKELTA